jgi:hypothetical protein
VGDTGPYRSRQRRGAALGFFSCFSYVNYVSRIKKRFGQKKMRRAAGAIPDANGRVVDFDHFNRRKWTRLDIFER